MYRPLLPCFLFSVVACTPQNAELTAGSYTAFLADSSSLSVAKGLIPLSFCVQAQTKCMHATISINCCLRAYSVAVDVISIHIQYSRYQYY